MFATHGLPEVLATDNGPCFTSEKFSQFMKRNSIRHVRTAPYHPASNGLAERAVQTVKEGLRKQKEGSIQARVNWFLFQYRITPHSSTGKPPAELLMGRQLRSHLDLMHPQLGERVAANQELQKEGHDKHAKARVFVAGDSVFARNFTSGQAWLNGVISQALGPLSYQVELSDGRVVCRHVDHLHFRAATPLQPAPSSGSEGEDVLPGPGVESQPLQGRGTPSAPELPVVPRSSDRVRRPPLRFASSDFDH